MMTLIIDWENVSKKKKTINFIKIIRQKEENIQNNNINYKWFVFYFEELLEKNKKVCNF